MKEASAETIKAMSTISSYVVYNAFGQVVKYGHCPAADMMLQAGPHEMAVAEEYDPATHMEEN